MHFLLLPRADGKYEVIAARTGQTRSLGSLAGARQAQAQLNSKR